MSQGIDQSGVQAVEDLARRSAEIPESGFISTSDDVPALAVVRTRTDEIVNVLDFGAWAENPLRPTGDAIFTDWQTFAEYVRARADDGTTLWAEEDAAKLTAVFNDHIGGFPGWRDYTATLDLGYDDEWLAWRDGQSPERVLERKHVSSPYLRLFTHQGFADFLEEHAAAIHKPQGDRTLPDAAKMLNVARTFQVQSRANFTGAVRTASGEVSVRYEPKETARGGEKGNIEVPAEFYLRVPIYRRGPLTVIRALFRWEQDRNSGELALGYKLLRVEEEQRQGFDAVVAEVSNRLADGPADGAEKSPWPINYGQAPLSVHTDRRPLIHNTFQRERY